MNAPYQPARYPLEAASRGQGEAASESLIDRHSHFDGLYTTSQDLRIEGTAEGEIQCEGTVNIAEGARATATIRANTVLLSGAAEGEIYCRERFVLQPTGRMRGRVAAASLVVEEGAFFEGHFRMVMGEEPASVTNAIEEAGPTLLGAGARADAASSGGLTEEATETTEEVPEAALVEVTVEEETSTPPAPSRRRS